MNEVFLIYDEHGNETSRVDTAKRLPVEFRLVQEKRGTKPRVYLFRTSERVAKQSCWIEEYPYEQRLWHRSGTSIMRTRVDSMPFDVSIFTNAVPSKRVRANVFVSLIEEEQQAFGRMPKAMQIKLLCVSTRMASQFEKPEFSYEHLLKYVAHVCTTQQRRQREAEERERMAKARYEAERRLACALHDDDSHRETLHIDVGVEGYQRTHYPRMNCFDHHYNEKASDLVDVPDTWLFSLLTSLIAIRPFQQHTMPIKPKYTQGELRKSNQILRGLVDLVDSHRMDWNILVLIYLHYERVYFKSSGLE